MCALFMLTLVCIELSAYYLHLNTFLYSFNCETHKTHIHTHTCKNATYLIQLNLNVIIMLCNKECLSIYLD